MSEVYQRICRLCLEVVPDGDCEPISEIDEEILKVLLINIDFDISDNVACKSCVQKLEDCFEFKSTCFYVDDYITPFVYTDIRVDIKKVFQKVMTKEEVNLENVKICRLCMTLIHIEDNAFIYNTDLKGGVPLKGIVGNCLPELDLNTVHEPSICELCLGSIEKLNDFMKTCHEIEQRIKNYYKMAAGHGIPCRISLVDLLKFNNSRTLSILIGIERDHLDAENALICSRNEDTISIRCEAENDVQTDDFELRDCNSSEDGSPSKGVAEIRTTASKGKRYFCHKCNYSSDKSNRVKMHMLTHSDNEVHGCTLCSFVTNAKLLLQAHMASHRGRTKRYVCPKCTYEANRKSCLNQHILKHKDNSEVKMQRCPSCPFKTKYRSSLWVHQVSHKNLQEIPKYKCAVCDYETRYKDSLVKHIRIHQDPKIANEFQCEKCSYRTKCKSYLNKHVMTHSIVHPYSCDQCTYSSNFKGNLVKHKFNHHKDGKRQIYKCKLCSYQAKTSNTINIHMIRTHKSPFEVSNFKCAHCSYKTVDKHNLLRHIRRHGIGNQPKLKCHLCTYETQEKVRMRQHLNVHGEATTQCCQCDFRTKWKYTLQRHIKQCHTGSCSSIKQQKISLGGHKNRCLKKKENDDKKKNKKNV